MKAVIAQALIKKNEYFWCLKWTYLFSHLFLIGLTIAFVFTGSQAVSTDIFHGDMKQFYDDYVLSVVFFSLFYFASFNVSIWITIKYFNRHNIVVGFYILLMFIFGFILMAVQG